MPDGTMLNRSTLTKFGIRVGEVTNLRLDPDDARQVLATISVAVGTPVRAAPVHQSEVAAQVLVQHQVFTEQAQGLIEGGADLRVVQLIPRDDGAFVERQPPRRLRSSSAIHSSRDFCSTMSASSPGIVAVASADRSEIVRRTRPLMRGA